MSFNSDANEYSKECKNNYSEKPYPFEFEKEAEKKEHEIPLKDKKETKTNSIYEKDEKIQKIESIENKEKNIKEENMKNEINKNKEDKKEINEKSVNNSKPEIEMNSKKTNSILREIKSKYISKYIFKYISTKKLLNLVNYSKSIQGYLNISLIDYKENHLSKIANEQNVLLYVYNGEAIIDYNANRNKSKDNYLNDLSKSKCDEKFFESFVIKQFKKTYTPLLKKICFTWRIDYNSPLLIPVLKTELIDLFDIMINDEIFKNNILFNDIVQMFNKINIENVRYPKICIDLSSINLLHLNNLNINFNKIEKLKINISIINFPDETAIDYSEHLIKIFSFFSEKQHLKQIELISYIPLKAESVDIINSITDLKILIIEGCQIEGIFILKLNNLEEIRFIRCKNIAFDESKNFIIKKLEIKETEIIKPKSILTLPEIEEINFDLNSNINSYFFCPKKKLFQHL